MGPKIKAAPSAGLMTSFFMKKVEASPRTVTPASGNPSSSKIGGDMDIVSPNTKSDAVVNDATDRLISSSDSSPRVEKKQAREVDLTIVDDVTQKVQVEPVKKKQKVDDNNSKSKKGKDTSNEKKKIKSSKAKRVITSDDEEEEWDVKPASESGNDSEAFEMSADDDSDASDDSLVDSEDSDGDSFISESDDEPVMKKRKAPLPKKNGPATKKATTITT